MELSKYLYWRCRANDPVDTIKAHAIKNGGIKII